MYKFSFSLFVGALFSGSLFLFGSFAAAEEKIQLKTNRSNSKILLTEEEQKFSPEFEKEVYQTAREGMIFFIPADEKNYRLKGFYVDRLPVTVKQYSSCMDANQCDNSLLNCDPNQKNADNPVLYDCISSESEKQYCEFIGKRSLRSEEKKIFIGFERWRKSFASNEQKFSWVRFTCESSTEENQECQWKESLVGETAQNPGEVLSANNSLKIKIESDSKDSVLNERPPLPDATNFLTSGQENEKSSVEFSYDLDKDSASTPKSAALGIGSPLQNVGLRCALDS